MSAAFFFFFFNKKIEEVYRHTLTAKININTGRINQRLMKIVTNRRQKGAGNSSSDKDGYRFSESFYGVSKYKLGLTYPKNKSTANILKRQTLPMKINRHNACKW